MGEARPATAAPPEANGKPPYYILATAALADEHPLVLKQGESFAVFDHAGDIKPVGLAEEGLYHEGTRFLSCLLLALDNRRPLYLSSTVREENDVLAADLTNPDLLDQDHALFPRGSLHLRRSKFLWGGVCYERLRVRNYGTAPVDTTFAYHFEADFADLFEVRGTRRERKGRTLGPEIEGGRVALGYEGLDGVLRRTRLVFAPAPVRLTATDAEFRLRLEPGAEASFDLTIACEVGSEVPKPAGHDPALAESSRALARLRASCCTVVSQNEQFNDWLDRAKSDLMMMATDTRYGAYPYAGVPWFSTPFGRDGIITALECLWADPRLAKGVLGYLAATQAESTDPARDAEPGKVLHEARLGEMAALGEIPFGRYYGSVDATPLFVMLAGAYLDRTGDRDFLERIWPNVERALGWIEGPGDPDGDGFVEYARRSRTGLIQQGWKDSHDSVFHADGSDAEPPIALCEVQGYVYAAKLAAADMAEALGHGERAGELRLAAAGLRAKFERAFWCDDIGTYALALDGAKRPCRVRSSNAGHCLTTGIADPAHAARVAGTLLSAASFSGWGIRTLAEGTARYNPMSYHNGSVWPHDNALIALGFARYGLQGAAVRVLEGLFASSLYFDLHRMPELFCGFPRRPGEGPTQYPVACSPQAWAAAAVLALLQACLGLRVDGRNKRVYFRYPALPESVREVRIGNLGVGVGSVDLLLIRHGDNVGINVLRREGGVEILTVK